jgi:2-polyprenyl-6-methoxyphenol hydroxylase-like FAD-dependent oxidoreductase
MADVDQILIVGGGIAGLSLATALRLQGYTPELVERSPAWPAGGAGINLPANGVRVLRALGLGEVVDRTAAVLRRWGFFDQQGELLCETDLEELWRDVGPCLGITRIRLQEALLTGAAAVPYRLGVSLTALSQDDNRVRVSLSDGTSVDYDLVVGSGRHLFDCARARGELFAAKLCWADGLAEHHTDTPSRHGRNDGSHGRWMLFRGSPHE